MKKILSIVKISSLLIFTSTTLMAETTATASYKIQPIDFVWLLIAAVLVFFMQAGFALVETGFTRAKNAGNIIMKNLMDFSIGAIAFFVIGWGLMYGKSIAGFIGSSDFFLTSASPVLPAAVNGVIDNSGLFKYVSWIFQAVFAATAATIVSGAIAERTKFKTYLVFSLLITAVIYPISGHWIWGDGWLSSKGFLDFAGSTAVHSVGGWAALVAAVIIGPRIGKYGKDGKAKAIPGHNIPLGALGVFILFFGWFGFNPGSTLTASGATGFTIGLIAVNTAIAGAAGSLGAMFAVWFKTGKPDVSMTLNGVLAGLVGITAGASHVSPTSSIIIGLLAGIIVVVSVDFIDSVLKIDDPVGAISVHGVVGAFGTLAVGLFAEAKFAGATGLFFGGGFKQLGIQAMGVAVVFVWVILTAGLIFWILDKTMGLRVTKEEELKGLDIEEHGMESYSGFQIFRNQ